VSNLIFGNKWQGIEYVIGYLGLMHSISWIVGLNNTAYASIGRPDLETKILIINLFFYIPIYIFSAKIGFEFFLVCRLLAAIFALFVHIYMSKIVFCLGFKDIFFNIKRFIMILFIITLFDLYITKNIISNSFHIKIFQLLAYASLYLLSASLKDKDIKNMMHTLLIKKEEK